LNGVIAIILRYFIQFDYVTVVEDRPSRFGVEYHLPVTFWQKLTHAAVARSLCDNWACCYIFEPQWSTISPE